MASRPSIVFLFDLDLPTVRPSRKLNGTSAQGEVEEESSSWSCASFFHHVSISILNHFSEKQANIQWGYRFYSSSNYQLTNKGCFADLTAQTLDDFENTLNVQYEQSSLPQTSPNHMTGASVLSRTLQDIISDYDWKTPSDSLTPTRKSRKTGKQLLDHNLQNLVFIFTEVPSDDSLASFCKLKQQEPSFKAVSDAVLPKELSKRFQDLQISLNFVDLCYNRKTVFSKIASSLKGAVINSAALVGSPFSFSQILQASCFIAEPSLQVCQSCQDLQLGSKVLLSISSWTIAVEVQCWDQTCSRSSLCSVEAVIGDIPVIKCVPISQSSIRSLLSLQDRSLYLLTSKSFSFPQSTRISWIGSLNGRVCTVCMVSTHSAALFFLQSDAQSLVHWAHLIPDEPLRPLHQSSVVRDFVTRFMGNSRASIAQQGQVPASSNGSNWDRLMQLKGNYGEKKGAHFGPQWEMLKDCFRKEEQPVEHYKEANNNCFDQLAQPIVSRDSGSSNEAATKRIGSSRIQNLRASTLLQKSQEVRAKNDKIEQEKDDKEKQMMSERRDKMWRDQLAYMDVLRSSVFTEDAWLQLVPVFEPVYSKQEILERCLQLKSQSLTSQLEDWQWVCVVQVIVSSILYAWIDKHSDNKELSPLEPAYDLLCKDFLKKPGAVSRSTPKDQKVFELKCQIILRLELTAILPLLIGEEDDMLQDTAGLLQQLSIHSSPKVMSSFYQDTLIFNYEAMLPDFLVNLGEELNQPIPASLSEEVTRKSKTPSPAHSSKTLSVQSLASQQEVIDSQRPVTRDLRSRTLSRQPSLTIMQHKKQITLPTKAADKSAPAVPKKEETSEVGKVRRSLQFGSETPRQKNRQKSPTKSATPRRLDSSFQPLLEFATPSKSTDVVLAPETPSRLKSGGKNARKTDGVHIVGESPEIKQECLRRSPRRLQAAMALRRRASFYSSMNSDLNPEKGASRNWARAESQVWSDKAKANVSLQTAMEDSNVSQTGQSAHFLFSKILSRNDSTPRKSDLDSETLFAPMNVLSTPLKGEPSLLPHSNTPSCHRVLAPDTGCSQMIPGTPMKTPMKTPKQVQFDLSFQPATPSSKIVPGTKSILKSPMPFRSPSQSRTPRKTDREVIESHTVHVLDETNFTGRHQLQLSSPVKLGQDEEFKEGASAGRKQESMKTQREIASDIVYKLDEKTLRPDEEMELSPSKMLATRRSPRCSPSKAAASFCQPITDWSAVHPMLPMADTVENMVVPRMNVVEPSPTKEVELSPSKRSQATASGSPLTHRRSLRRSPAFQSNPAANFFQRNPNWSVVDYRRPNVEGLSRVSQNVNRSPDVEDPYKFDEELEAQASRRGAPDVSSHKRKLFQSSAEKPPSTKRRRVVPSPIKEVKTTPTRFHAPMESSLFHLENSPLLSSIEGKFAL